MVFNIRNYLKDFTSEASVKNELKEKLEYYFGCQHVSLVTNGTQAIEVVLRAMGIERGSLVIVPDISFIATATAVANCGLVPVFADVSSEYYGVTLEGIKKMYNEKVKAVIVVHWGGFVNREIFDIKKYCMEKGIFLIEDCAQSFPCEINGQKTGTIGDAGTCSFQSSKIIHSGEGGMILTNSPQIAQQCEKVINWGLSFAGIERDLCVASSNFRMSAVQCYFVLKQVEMIEEIVKERSDRCKEFTDLCHTFNIEPSLPDGAETLMDSPFFFPLKSREKHNTIEPRTEYPMRKSTMVPAIIKKFYPDLLETYQHYVELANKEQRLSDAVISENDFINIINSYDSSPEKMVLPYKNLV